MYKVSPGEGKVGATFRRIRKMRLLTVALLVAASLAPGLALGQPPQRDRQFDAFAVMLVRNTLTALNHANLTGKYTVLRDLGSPSFRERNSAAQLATIFQRLREQKSDLSPILVHDPVFTEGPVVNQAGELQIAGFFPTQPLHVQFRLGFQRVPAGWVIDTVSVGTVAPQAWPQNVGNVPPQPANVTVRPPDGYTR